MLYSVSAKETAHRLTQLNHHTSKARHDSVRFVRTSLPTWQTSEVITEPQKKTRVEYKQ